MDRCTPLVPAQAAVVFAVSAGGLTPLIEILGSFAAEFHAAVIIALHTGADSALPAVLRPRCRLPVKFAEDGELTMAGTVYIAPPLRHLLVNADRSLSVVDRGYVRFARPSADWLFETVAASYGRASIAVVLSGFQRDGARGVVSVYRAGGAVLVQCPDSSQVRDMPNAAIRTGVATAILASGDIGAEIARRVDLLDLERCRLAFDHPFAAE